MRIQKGGMCTCKNGVWSGKNASGRADAELLNFLGIECGINYWESWENPELDGGIKDSSKWTEENQDKILGFLEKIKAIRTEEIENATDENRRAMFTDHASTKDNHSRILMYVMQWRNIIKRQGMMNWENALTEEGDRFDKFDITKTDGWLGVVSEVGNMNPTLEESKYSGTNMYSTKTGGQKSMKKKSRKKKSRKKKSRKKKSRKKKKKKKSIRKTMKIGKKKFHILPTGDKTMWSNDYFGKRQMVNILKKRIINRVDNSNPITGELKDKISDEYKRRLKIQLKKHKPSRKRFHNKTKKKYNSKSIDKMLSKMTDKKIETIYKDLLSNEKSTKRN